MANHHINPRRIKIHRSYTVKDAADVLGTHKNTVRLWIKQGLPTTDEHHPAMMLGTAIRAFLENRKAKRKHRLAAAEFYCLKCRAPKIPAGGMADYAASSADLGNLIGLCPDCETIMNKRTSLAKLDRIKGQLDVKICAAAATHKRMNNPSLNCDSSEGHEPMKKTTRPNERIKREYFIYLKEAKGRNEASIDGVAKALSRLETYTKFRDFKQFHVEQAKGFKAHLAGQENARTGKGLSVATLYSTLSALKAFFQWLAGSPGYKSRIAHADAEYFNLSEKETRVATAHRDAQAPTIEQIRHVLESMPQQSDIERRNRALIAFILLTGARDGATASFKLKHIDLGVKKIEQDAREVKTKRSKTFTTCFFPVGDDIRAIVVDWVNFLRKEKLWSNDDPLFPATLVIPGAEQRFEAIGLARKYWSNATPIRTIIKTAFAQAGLPYFNPHGFRKTLVQLGQRICQTPEQFKAWSQNLGHDSPLTTFTSYGKVAPSRQLEIIGALGQSTGTTPSPELLAMAAQFVEVVRRF